jgi:hypothetical protein
VFNLKKPKGITSKRRNRGTQKGKKNLEETLASRRDLKVVHNTGLTCD